VERADFTIPFAHRHQPEGTMELLQARGIENGAGNLTNTTKYGQRACPCLQEFPAAVPRFGRLHA
jgi:hypothetical protein